MQSIKIQYNKSLTWTETLAECGQLNLGPKIKKKQK